jgi:xanthine dehydrogenase small subunit
VTSGLELEVDGVQVRVPDDGASLMEVLRDRLGHRSVKDGCSPQGQCGCCTVLVDGKPRVSCVTPARRVQGRSITTLDGLDESTSAAWGEAFAACGGSQCGFCTPGIVIRLEGLRRNGTAADDVPAVERALQAHLCRCTGWQTIPESYANFGSAPTTDRDWSAASARAGLEGHADQSVGPAVALGDGGFADDLAPAEALVAVPGATGDWVVARTLVEARALSGKVQGRRTTVEPEPILELPAGEWAATLRTSWVDPGYLELDASWCEPGGEPISALGNAGAFGAKATSPVEGVARRLADEHGQPVRVLLPREDVVRRGVKRPPVAGGAHPGGAGIIRVLRTPGIVEAIAAVAPDLVVEEVDAPGPPTSIDVRGAGWAEATILMAGARGSVGTVTAPEGGTAEVAFEDGTFKVRVDAGEILDPVVLRSYCIGAVHMGFSWVTSEGLAVDETGEVLDLTVRSLGITRASDMPPVEVEIVESARSAVNGSDAVFAAAAAATWLDLGCPCDWPTGRG